VILAAIVFTTLIPLLIFLQNTTTLYHLQVLERNRFEAERLQENLEVHATVSPGSNDIYLLVRNKGTLAVNLTSVYIADSGGGLTTWTPTGESSSVISPLSSIIPIKLDVAAEEDKSYMIHAATDRGRSYAAAEKPLNITDPPYILQVTILNMKYDRRYLITVEVADWGEDGLRLGCVVGSQPCQPQATMDFYSLRWNDNQTFIFKLLPGNYSISVTELKWSDTGWTQTDELGPEYVLVLGDTSKIIQFPYNAPQPINPESDLMLMLKLPETVMTDEQEVTINGNLIVGLLQTANEPLRNLNIEIEITDYHQIDISSTHITPEEITINRILPGQALIYNITIDTKLISDIAGGYITLRAELDSAQGERTGQEYTNIYSQEQTTTICILTTIENVYEVRCGSVSNCWGCTHYCESISDPDAGYVCTRLFCIPIPFDEDICCCRCTIDLGVIPRCDIPP